MKRDETKYCLLCSVKGKRRRKKAGYLIYDNTFKSVIPVCKSCYDEWKELNSIIEYENREESN